MTEPSLSVVVATTGRSTIEPLLAELLSQLGEQDEVVVVADGPRPWARRAMASISPRVRYLEYGPMPCWGHPQREAGMRAASKEYVSFLNDDDMAGPAYAKTIKAAAEEAPGRPLVFRMQLEGIVLWSAPSVSHGNVSTQMFALPNVKDRLGEWGRCYSGDFFFLRSTLALYPDGEKAAVWRPEIVAIQGMRWSKVKGSGLEDAQ